MKYTKLYFFLAALSLSMPLLSQVNYPPPGNAFVASADSGSDQRDDSVLTIRKRVDEVNLLFIATDRHGKFVRNLNEGDFSILDDHKPPQSVVSFRRETDLPLRLGLLIDTSGSVRTRFSFEQEAAVSFLQQTVRRDFDQAFVMGFNGQSTVTQDFSGDGLRGCGGRIGPSEDGSAFLEVAPAGPRQKARGRDADGERIQPGGFRAARPCGYAVRAWRARFDPQRSGEARDV
ncbi:MAG: VWA domain-containing protein, partial [Acidobacteriia bacterium]|nr:VWA domain-containing protein [Terriglobia bacterium]